MGKITVTFDNGVPVDAVLLSDCVEGSHPKYGRGFFFTANCVTELFTHPPAQPDTEALKARIAEMEAARIAYASEFPLSGNGEPDVGSIHQNIRALKAQIAAQAGQEPIALSRDY